MLEAEGRHQPENIEIPQHWNFLGRNNPCLKIRQIDIDKSFLGFDLPDNPISVTLASYKGEYGDIFFDEEGRELDKRVHGAFDTHINLVRDIKVSYSVHEWASPSHADLDIIFLKSETAGPSAFELGGVNYDSSHLGAVHLGSQFIGMQGEENDLRSPLLIIGQYSQVSLRSGNWEINFSEGLPVNNSFAMSHITERQVVFNQDREPIFKVEWGIQKSGLEEEKDRAYLLSVSQTHIPTGIIKTLKAPLGLDIEKVLEAVFSRPPYRKDDRGRLVIPWRNIDRIVGAGLSYSYPPQTPQK